MTTGDMRNIDAGPLLLGAGALLLFVSLFLHWYKPGLDAWTIFESWDLVLTATAVVALMAVAGRMNFTQPRPDAWLLGPAALALVVVVVELINPPPLALGGDPEAGLWLALASATLMALGAVLSVARISVAVNIAGARRTEPIAPDPDAEPATPARSRRRIVGEPAATSGSPDGDEPAAGKRPPTAPTRPI
jgi:hypothetical protein